MTEFYTWLDFGECRLIGDISQDETGDLHAENVRVEMWIAGRLMQLRPIELKHINFLIEKLLTVYEQHTKVNV